MKHYHALALVALLSATPAFAQDDAGDGKSDMKDGMSLLEEGARLFMRGLADEMEPALRDLAEGVQPALRELLDLVEDFDAYHMPERLPNGDIIIRRKSPMDDDAPAGDVEI